MSRYLFLAFLTGLLLGSAPSQDPRGRREQEPKPVLREQKPVLSKAARLAIKKQLAGMQGAWRLVDMRIVGQDAEGIGGFKMDQVGFCLVSGSYISIELHVRLLGKGGGDSGRSLATGLHSFELDEEGGLETSTVIGTITNVRGDVDFEPPGTTRRYSCSLEVDSMTLTRDDGHTLVFERLVDDTTRFDFYGRPVTEKEQAAGDEENGEEKKDDEKEDEGDEDGDR